MYGSWVALFTPDVSQGFVLVLVYILADANAPCAIPRYILARFN
jgi:hypothetical protein